MSLRLDVYVKKKGIDRRAKIIDLRRYRQSKNEYERLIDKLYQDLTVFGVKDKDNIVNDLKKVPNFMNLNFSLLILVYLYYSSKNFDPGNVILNFDEDFKAIVKDINDRDIFMLNKKDSLYDFRQDFIIYLLLINKIDEETEETIEQDINSIEEKLEIQGEDNEYNNKVELYDDDYYEQYLEEYN